MIKQETHFKLISCIEQLHLQNKHSSWQSCFGSTGLSLNPIENCYNNGLGYQVRTKLATLVSLTCLDFGQNVDINVRKNSKLV